MTMGFTPLDWRRWSGIARLGEVRVVAPATEQSGVGHSITYLTPLIVKEIFHDGRYPGRPGSAGAGPSKAARPTA